MIPQMKNQNEPARKSTPVLVSVGPVELAGDLHIPAGAEGIVIFAHGSGSSRMSPRNIYVAEVLHTHAVGTLLIDLLTEQEEYIDRQTGKLRFDIPLLADRLSAIGRWVHAQPPLGSLKIGYFGASTGGAAALIAAAKRPEMVAAVVSRGGRPDLAMKVLHMVKAPTLLVVGEDDSMVLEWNKQALAQLNDQSKLETIPRATHLFEEPGALEKVAQLAAEWFVAHFK